MKDFVHLGPPFARFPRVERHLARVQQRWRYADDEFGPDERLNLEALAHDFSALPDTFDGPPEHLAETLLQVFDDDPSPRDANDTGGSIEPAADSDGVLIAEAPAAEPAIQP